MRIDQIEDALLSILRADPALAGYVRTFAVIPSLDEAVLERTFKQFPAIGAVSTEGAYEYAMNGVQDERGTFQILCINRNLRSPVDALRGGAAAEKGLWHMIDDCRAALLAAPDLGLPGVDCLPKRRSLLHSGDKWSAAALEIDVKWRHQ